MSGRRFFSELLGPQVRPPPGHLKVPRAFYASRMTEPPIKIWFALRKLQPTPIRRLSITRTEVAVATGPSARGLDRCELLRYQAAPDAYRLGARGAD